MSQKQGTPPNVKGEGPPETGQRACGINTELRRGTAANMSLALPLLKENFCLLLRLLLPQVPPLKILIAGERQKGHLSSHHRSCSDKSQHI